jgi:hypothetical protein
MRSVTPGDDRDLRPPVAITAAPSPGGAGRRSVWQRPLLQPQVLEDGGSGFPVHHPYVRKFWTAAIGPSAVADLLRLITAANRRQPVPYPERMNLLVAAGLVLIANGGIWVRPLVPPVTDALVRHLRPSLRTEHRREVTRSLEQATSPSDTN